jgi:hypothetical protein
MTELSDNFSQDFEILNIVTSELKLASLLELQTVYSVHDMYDILELMEANAALAIYHHKIEEQRRANQQTR